MKAAVILFFILAYIQAEVFARAVEGVTPLEPEEEECIDSLNLNKKEIQRLNSQEIAPEDNSDFNKFIGCYYQKMGWQDLNGKIDYNMFRATMERAIDDEMKNESDEVERFVKQMMLSTVDECEANPPPKGNTHGETAVRVQNCVMQKLNSIINEQSPDNIV